jgi:hypothetical protein
MNTSFIIRLAELDELKALMQINTVNITARIVLSCLWDYFKNSQRLKHNSSQNKKHLKTISWGVFNNQSQHNCKKS